jgi:hypothetical protein
MFIEVTLAVDASIRQTHGIMCHQDGNLTNLDISNVYVLHVCNVMDIHMRKKKGMKTQLFIQTHSLSFILETMRNKLVEETLSGDLLSFF